MFCVACQHVHLRLVFTSNSVVFVDGGAKIFFTRGTGTLASLLAFITC